MTADPDPPTTDDELILLLVKRRQLRQILMSIQVAQRESYLTRDDHDTLLDFLRNVISLPAWLNDR